MFSFKVAAKKRIFVSRNSHVTNIWKTIFPKEFLNEKGEHEYILHVWIKFEKKNILFKDGDHNKFWDIAQ